MRLAATSSPKLEIPEFVRKLIIQRLTTSRQFFKSLLQCAWNFITLRRFRESAIAKARTALLANAATTKEVVFHAASGAAATLAKPTLKNALRAGATDAMRTLTFAQARERWVQKIKHQLAQLSNTVCWFFNQDMYNSQHNTGSSGHTLELNPTRGVLLTLDVAERYASTIAYKLAKWTIIIGASVCTISAAVFAVQTVRSREMLKRVAQSKTRTTHLRQRYEEVVEALNELRGAHVVERIEDHLLKQEISPEEVSPEGEVIMAAVNQYVVTHHGKFARALVTAAKTEFGGIPKNTPANQLAVWKYLYRLCDKRGVNPMDTYTSICAALPFVFAPCVLDADMAITCQSDEMKVTLSEYTDIFRKVTPLQRLFANPTSGKEWRRWAKSLLISEPSEGLTLAK